MPGPPFPKVRSWSLRLKLMALSVAALTPGFIVIGVTQYQVSQSRKAEVRDLALRGATQASFELARIIAAVQSLLTAVVREPAVRKLDAPECSAYLGALQPDLPHLVGLTVIDAEGSYRCGSTPPPPGASFKDRDYFKAAVRDPALVVGSYTIGRYSKRPVLPVVLGMRDDAGQVTGVVIAAVDLGWLSEQLKERGLPEGGSVTVADRNGVIVARQPFPEQFVGTRIPDAFMRLVHGTVSGTEEVLSQDGTRRTLGYVPPSVSPVSGLYVSVGLSTQASYGTVVRAAWLGAFLAALVGVTTLAATWIAGDRLFARPLRTLAGSLQRWREGDRMHRTGMDPDQGEIGELGAALDRMMDAIQRNQDERELLSSELAHRIKNMLAMVQAIASSTLDKPDPSRSLLPDFLARIAALGRAQDALTADAGEGAELTELVRAVVHPLVADMDARVTAAGPAVHLPAREALGMTMVLHELCTNAIKYGALSVPTGHVVLRWELKPAEPAAELELVWREDGGPPVEPPGDRKGFGTRLMARAFGEKGRVQLDHARGGIVCAVTVRLQKA